LDSHTIMSHEEFPTEPPAVVTCGLPYANGDLHVGHLRSLVGGDAYARALEKLGQRTAFVCGSDMHGTPIAVNAAQEGIDPEELALRYHEQHAAQIPQFNVEFDFYGHTRQPANVEQTVEFVERLEEGGHIYEKEILVAWDPEAEQALPDRYVEGTCPYCGETARGDECDEGCGRHLEPGEIEDPRSTITGNPAEYREREHKFFRLQEFQEYLQGFIDRLEGTENARTRPREWIEGELKDWCITRDLDWGIEYPGREDLVLYVWVDAPTEYVSTTRQYTEQVGPETYDWERVWQEDGEIVHVIGQDIIQHHTVFWPALLHGVDYNEPRAVMACGFVNIDGKAFSKSRNRAVWAEELLESPVHPDSYRYFTVTGSGFESDVNFSWSGLAERVNGELVGSIGNFIYRSLLFAHREYGGTPEVEPSEETVAEIEAALGSFREAVNDYEIRGLGTGLLELARYGNEYIQREEPWNLTDEDPEQAAQVIRDCVQLSKALAVLMEPTMPGKAAALWTQLGENGSVHDARLEAALEAPPAAFDAPEELFDGLEDEAVAELEVALEERVEAPEEVDEQPSDDSGGDTGADGEPEPDLEPVLTERVPFETFQEMDLRVGRITSAEPIEGADELLRLEVDIGVETRQVVAGLAQLHDVDALPGTRVVLVANLAKSEIFGVESNGMVLAAGDQADLLTTHDDAVPGTRVR
jgi:methionyl-tRNA synthetase